MAEPVYRKQELVGTSPDSIEDAIRSAVTAASQAGDRVDWFEVIEVRGAVRDGQVKNFQVVLKAGVHL